MKQLIFTIIMNLFSLNASSNTLKISVFEDIVGTATNVDSNVKWQFKVAEFSYLRKTMAHKSTQNKGAQIQPHIKEIVIDFIRENSTVETKTVENHFIARNLASFLEFGRPKEGFCCIDLVNYLAGVHCFNDFDPNFWTIVKKPLQEKLLKPGNMIQILNGAGSKVHFALYIGRGLYLSLFGTSGPLIVASLGEMYKGFSGKIAHQIVPSKYFFIKP